MAVAPTEWNFAKQEPIGCLLFTCNGRGKAGLSYLMQQYAVCGLSRDCMDGSTLMHVRYKKRWETSLDSQQLNVPTVQAMGVLAQCQAMDELMTNTTLIILLLM